MGTLVQNRQIISGTLSPTNKYKYWRLYASNMKNLEESSDASDGQIKNTSEILHVFPCSESLDWKIWSNLQPDLVTRILSHLPFTALIHTRLVCRKWDREIYSGQVLGHDTVQRNSTSWLFLFENGGPGNPHKLHAFDPLQSQWHIFNTIPHFATVQKIGGLSLCGASSGLMVYQISALKSHFTRFGVFNPITRSWKKLPPLSKRRQRPVVCMFTENFSCKSLTGLGHYKLVVAGGLEYDQPVQSTEVFDSRTESWRIACERFNNQQSHVSDEMRTSTAFCDGIVYHMRFNQMLSFDPNREYHTLMAYDTRKARWRPLRASLPPDLVFTEYPSVKRIWKGRAYLTDVLPPFLVESNSRLLLVGFLEDRFSSTVSGIAVWELIQKKVWKPLTMMPDTLFGQMCPKICSAYVDPSSYLKYEVQGAGHGEYVYIFQANEVQGFVVLCDLSCSPPAWRCIRNGIVPDIVSCSPRLANAENVQKMQGCVIDLRFDTLI